MATVSDVSKKRRVLSFLVRVLTIWFMCVALFLVSVLLVAVLGMLFS